MSAGTGHRQCLFCVNCFCHLVRRLVRSIGWREFCVTARPARGWSTAQKCGVCVCVSKHIPTACFTLNLAAASLFCATHSNPLSALRARTCSSTSTENRTRSCSALFPKSLTRPIHGSLKGLIIIIIIMSSFGSGIDNEHRANSNTILTNS